jgi:3-methylcrotonyl-CoA carboxylase alpha subunit
MFSSLLIANRGEIASRIIRTARQMGLRSIAVYSDADQTSPYVAEADEAHHIGPSEAKLSYLNGAHILAVAEAAKAEAIHPGYGFLSENADFAEACAQRGIVFVGPSPSAIRSMGLKDRAKVIAQAAGVPVIPGYQGSDQSLNNFLKQAEKLGYPLIIKAIAGGGGRGMRIVETAGEFAAALDACRREAKAAFGDDGVFLEKYFPTARHVEVQLMGDRHGSILHFFERDCSIQRRHQKIIEEAPAFGIPETVRSKLQASAIAVARAVDYHNAGTVEFLYDPRSAGFFFMEMNTRLQVEHPVSEIITGLDLVELQLLVAAGERLPVQQAQIEANGHAIEARLYAEDPAQDFLPQTGIVHELIWPSDIGNCRIDTGIARGTEIGTSYDSMVAKIIAWGKTRKEAIGNLDRALQNTFLFGLKTNKAFLLAALNHPRFAAEAPTTRFLDEAGDLAVRLPSGLLIAGLACFLFGGRHSSDPWSMISGWTLAGGARRERRRLSAQGRAMDVTATYDGTNIILDIENGRHVVEVLSAEPQTVRLSVDGHLVTVHFYRSGSQLFIDVDGHHLTLTEPDYSAAGSEVRGEGSVRAPMPGRILKLEVGKGDAVRAGDRLLLLEAMKMEHVLRAPLTGCVGDIFVAEGKQVREGDELCIITPEAR